MQPTWKTTTRLSILVIAAFFAAATDLAGQGPVETCEQISLSIEPPLRPTLPRRLRLSVPSARPARSSGSKLAMDAQRAASQTARRLAEEGHRQAYRLGFYDGLHTAFKDAGPERIFYRYGLESGRRSPGARRTGSELGYDAGREAAEDAARRGVREERHKPWRRTRATVSDPSFFLPEKQAPSLEEIFREYPLSDYLLLVLLNVSANQYLDPWSLYLKRSHREVYDSGWQEAAAALEDWMKEHPQDRRRRGFQELYFYHYPRELARISSHEPEHGYAKGFTAGWRYGFVVQWTSSCRRGFSKGWNETARSSALVAFRRGFQETQERRTSLSSPR